MDYRRSVVSLLVIGMVAFAVTPVSAEPIDTWDTLVGIDCVGDRFNPVREDGTKDPDGDPEPGSPEWDERDAERRECDNQRDHDRRYQPPFVNAHSVARYGEDWYRQPFLLDGVRFHFDYFPTGTGQGGVPAMEVYRPCSNAPDDCPDLPEGLERFDPPYPVVVVHHGFIAQMTHHRYNAQAFAEAGYLAISVNGTHPVTGAPNVQSNTNAGQVLEWLASEDSGEIGEDADLDRVALAGHSQGSAASLSYQGDPRVHAILAWDGGDGIAENNTAQPIMYQRTDGAFSAPQTTARSDYPEGRDRGLTTYLSHKERGMDVYHVTFRATNHIDWNGNGVGSLAANRLAELLINYYSLGWLDRHLKGKLVFDADGNVVTYDDRTESQERSYRQAQAQDAFDRLTAMKFDGSADRHHISMGWYDPVQHATSGDPLYGGNVPYSIDGLWVTDRLSQEFRSFCSVSVPDYMGGGDGTPGSAVVARADSGAEGDVRLTGCTEGDGGDDPDDPEADVTVTCLDCAIEVRAGESGEARLEVTNAGDDAVSVVLDASAPSGWATSVTPSELVLQPGQGATLTLQVATPRSAKGSQGVEVTATGGGGAASDSVTVAVTKGKPNQSGGSPTGQVR